ncbi:hypothetical protein ACLKA6_007132 [Drosophila palustris]
MGNSFEKFAGGGSNDYNNANSRRGWSRRRRRLIAASSSPSAVVAAAAAAAAPTENSLGCTGCSANSRRWLTHVSSTPNLGETTSANDALEPRSSSFSYAVNTSF